MPHPPALSHDPIQTVDDDLFFVRGEIALNPIMRITRNMTIVRHDGELSLVNAVRLSAEGEAQLESLGEVQRILRLGPFHGRDDAYYKDRYGAELWAQARSETYPEPSIDVTLGGATPLPFPDAELFEFRGTQQPESILRLTKGRGTLVSCDAIQNYGDYRHNNLPAKLVMPFIGFKKTTIIGPFWVKLFTPEGGSLEAEFRRLLALDFDRLLPAHGSLLESGAKAAVQRAFDRTYGRG